MIGLVGVAVDFGIWNQTNATLSVAANVAALTAVRIAANAQVANDPHAQTEGVAAGDQYFAAEVGIATRIGTEGVTLVGDGTFGAKVGVTMGPTVTATVAYTGTVPSVFGFAMFGYQSYPISGQAVAAVTTAPYLNVMMMLDDSSSMQIGATDSDIETMQSITPCNQLPTMPGSQAPGAVYPSGVYSNTNLAGQAYYPTFDITGYDGDLPPVVTAPPGVLVGQYAPGSTDPSCKGFASYVQNGVTKYASAGAPCAFACHFDTSGAPAGTGNDYYGLARSTIGTANPVTLRFDLLKQATNNVISTMQLDNITQINNLQVGIYSFSTGTTRAYPDPSCGTGQTCEASNAWSTALADVGGPASYANGADTGILPSLTPTSANTGDTNFHQAMVQLKGMLTPSGDGTVATSPRKVLFLVTDGMTDGLPDPNISQLCSQPTRCISGIDVADCTLFKSAPYNYTVYVVYTPYYPLQNQFYIGTMKGYAEPLVGSPVYNAMQACASTPQDFISAADGPTLNAALQKFLKQALNAPARFTQ